MSIVSIVVPYEFVSKNVKLTWKDILYGIERNYLSPNAAIEHAMILISESGDCQPTVFELASLSYDDSVFPFINHIAGNLSDADIDMLNEKWLFILLDWLYIHRNQFDDALSIVEYIYSDFDYPAQIANFIRYTPTEEPNLGSKELNEKRLYDKWIQYLENQRAIYTNEA